MTFTFHMVFHYLAFRRQADLKTLMTFGKTEEIFALLGRYAAWVDSWLPTLRESRRWDRKVVPKRRWTTAHLRCVTSQKCEDFSYTTAEAWNHAKLRKSSRNLIKQVEGSELRHPGYEEQELYRQPHINACLVPSASVNRTCCSVLLWYLYGPCFRGHGLEQKRANLHAPTRTQYRNNLFYRQWRG